MSDDSDPPADALTAALAELWLLPRPGPDGLFAAPEFVRLKTVSQSLYPGAGNCVFALGNALCNLGLPCGLPAERREVSLAACEAAHKLDGAFRARHARRWHLAPLDLADELPALSFGPATLRRFTADQLRALVDAPRRERAFPRAAFDAERFAEFQWLAIEEVVALDQPPEARAVPVLFADMRQDFGRIEPHKGHFPSMLEDALFFLLLAPWEDWSRMPEVDWRGFRVPWVHTTDEDLFVRPSSMPTPESLSWEPQALTDTWGEVIEVERPVVLPLENGSAVGLQGWNARTWVSFVAARRSPLFDTPVAHFFVRAYLANGVDELLGHLTAIEAALGLQADYDRRLRPNTRRPMS